MPKTAKDRDFTTIARNVVEKAIGERFDGSPLETIVVTPAMSRGRLGGLKGGVSRAKKLSAKRRKAIAAKAAKSRWHR
jgi:hypothetical protein